MIVFLRVWDWMKVRGSEGREKKRKGEAEREAARLKKDIKGGRKKG